MATVTVQGWATRDVEPDRVRVTLGLESVDTEVRTAVEDLARRSAILDAVLDDLGDDVLARRPSSLWVAPRHRYGRDGPRLVGQAAERTVIVELSTAGSIGSVLARVATELGVRVLGTDWLVDPANPAHGELRAAAVRDAHARAGQYAAAAGLRLGDVETLAEPHVSGRGRAATPEDGDIVALAAPVEGGDDQRVVLDLRPEAVRLTAAVTASYALLEG